MVASVVNALIYHHNLRSPDDTDALASLLESGHSLASDDTKSRVRALIVEVTAEQARIASQRN